MTIRFMTVAAVAMALALCGAKNASAITVVADDFFYLQPTDDRVSGGGITDGDHGGGQNGGAGQWVGLWDSIGDAIINSNVNSADEPLPEDQQFMATAGTLFTPATVQRDYQLNGLGDEQTLYFGGRMRTSAGASSRIILSDRNNIDAEISVGLDGTNEGAGLNLGDLNNFTNEIVDVTAWHLVVGKLEVNANGTSERLTVWVDPTDVETGPSATLERDVITGLGDLVTTFELASGVCCSDGVSGAPFWDDVAIGTEWNDVAAMSIPRLSVDIDSETGEATLSNNTGTDLDINYLEFKSGSGSLSTVKWNSLDAQNVGNSIGNGGGNGPEWVENSSDNGQLIESKFLGDTTIADGASISLGEIFRHLLEADFDGSGAVNGDDFLVWQNNFPTAEGATRSEGDADGDGDTDGDDFLLWQAQFLNAFAGTEDIIARWGTPDGLLNLADVTFSSSQSGGGGGASIPEPTAVALLAMTALAVVSRRGR